MKLASEGKGIDVSYDLAKVSMAIRNARDEETGKSAALWVILSLLAGITILYIYYFLMKDIYTHFRRQTTSLMAV